MSSTTGRIRRGCATASTPARWISTPGRSPASDHGGVPALLGQLGGAVGARGPDLCAHRLPIAVQAIGERRGRLRVEPGTGPRRLLLQLASAMLDDGEERAEVERQLRR